MFLMEHIIWGIGTEKYIVCLENAISKVRFNFQVINSLCTIEKMLNLIFLSFSNCKTYTFSDVSNLISNKKTSRLKVGVE